MSPYDRADAAAHPSAPQRGKLPSPRFDHLRRLTDRAGLWEHAQFSTPRADHGFCTDDNARALVVVSRQTAVSGGMADLAATYLGFVLEARTPTGAFHNRRDADGLWLDDVGSDDSQGRAWWGIGVAARAAPIEWMRRAAVDALTACSSFESPHLRANAYAVLGAVAAMEHSADQPAVRDLLVRASDVIDEGARNVIPWPEIRITYDNARLPEALLAAGSALGDRRKIGLGLRLLEWLVTVETNGNHFSFAPAGGWSIGEPRPGFDQQPIEAWTMADACHRAWVVTGSALWRVRALRAARWLLGDNDIGATMYDPQTGATFDGLERNSVNENCGAESALAGIGALQVARSCESDLGRLPIL